MPCEFLVEYKAAGAKPRLLPCGNTAKYFSARRGVGAVRTWLCWKHERYCAVVLQWELEQLQPREDSLKPEQNAPEV
jgi:hypothetical protein